MTQFLATEDGEFNGNAVDAEFEQWISALEEDVIQGEYGYEPGEFNVTPSAWRHLFDEGLSPLDAFKRALAAHRDNRDRTA